MQVEVRHVPGAVALQVRGELDLATGADLRGAFDGVGAGADVNWELDLRDVTFVDCAGLRALLRSVRSAERRGNDVSIVGASMCVARLSAAWGATRVVAPV